MSQKSTPDEDTMTTTSTDEMVVIINDTGDHIKGDSNQIYSVIHKGDGDSDMLVVQMSGSKDGDVDVTEVGGEDGGEQQVVVSADEFFQCAVCRTSFISQVDFFVHLKAHYEPERKKKAAAPEPIRAKQSVNISHSFTPKKRGRKSKQELAAIAAEIEAMKQEKEEEPPAEETPAKTTRSGRVSKPRPRDLDMIPLSPIKPKAEPLDALEEMADEINDQNVEIDVDAELASDYQDDEDEVRHVTKRAGPRKKRRRTQNVRKPRKNAVNVKRVQLEENGPMKLECEICHKLYANTTSMQVHMRIHNGEKPFQCMECGRSFRQQSDLKYHQASLHSTKKAFQCEFCGKEFSRKYSLTIHQKIHTGVRDYKCDICQKGFRAAIYMTEHRRIHTGEKPFQCDVCGRGFRIKSDMDRHRINVHFKGRKGDAMKVEVHDEDASAVIKDDEEMEEDEAATAAQYVTITGKDEDGNGGAMHRLVFISENEAILV